MASEEVLQTRDGRQWVLSTCMHFRGQDFWTDADDSNYARIITRPKTLLLRGGLYVIQRDSLTEIEVSVGIAGDKQKYAGALLLDTVDEDHPFPVHPSVGAVLPEYLPESETIYVTLDAPAANQDGEYLLHFEYLINGRENEDYS